MALHNRKGVDYVENVEQPDKWQDPSTEVKTAFYDISKNNPRHKDTVAVLTEDQRDDWVHMLVTSVFEMVNKDWQKYTAVYQAK
ncbi:uncharacterized protein TrAtP1_007094 [Trichoderma atroviride]|uniref:uncharacterized protein n=1 Tax=Hypocrea atroviridis TaxID=63577 RepID=UPI00331F7BB3|nr:hypothetical protein TrAtP1_007094 [Trichoderma atroviride]